MILNATQHSATQAQADMGVVDLPINERAELKALLTFDELPSKEEIEFVAEDIARLLHVRIIQMGASEEVMIGGAPFLMPALERSLLKRGLVPVYAFSQRVSEDTHNEDGTVSKKMVFKHLGFVRPH